MWVKRTLKAHDQTIDTTKYTLIILGKDTKSQLGSLNAVFSRKVRNQSGHFVPPPSPLG